MRELGLKPNETDKLVKIMPFTYIREDQLSKYNLLMENMEKEINEEIDKDINGNGFVKDMFKSAILNGEDDNIKSILRFIGITEEEFEKKDNLKKRIRIGEKRVATRKDKRRGRRKGIKVR